MATDSGKDATLKKKVVYARKKPAKKPAQDVAAEEEAAKAAAAAEAEDAAARLAEVQACTGACKGFFMLKVLQCMVVLPRHPSVGCLRRNLVCVSCFEANNQA